MQTRAFLVLLSLAYILFAILGFIPALHSAAPANAPSVHATADYGYLFGVFPVNLVDDLINLVIGLLGLACAARLDTAIGYIRFLFVVFGLMTVAGFMPQLDTLGGVAPMLGGDIVVHAISCLLCGYFGFVAVPDEVLAAPA